MIKRLLLLFWLCGQGVLYAQHHHMNAMQPDSGVSSDTRGPHTVIYHLTVSDTLVNYTGKHRRALAINGTIPAPTLYFTEGDTAEIYVRNTLKEETIIHWHGVILPNQEDGVPYLTTAPIEPGQTHLFKFPIVQSGTYWYHSHAGWQQQNGMYGALVFRKRAAAGDAAAGDAAAGGAAPSTTTQKDYTLLLSDWTDEHPYQVDRRLHAGTDWYAIRKGSEQDYAAAAAKGYLKTKLTNEWKRMLPMDVSDVAYDRFLANGRPADTAARFKAGDKVRLHLVNGSSSTYFWLQFAGGKITVVANDGVDVVPVQVDRMLIAVAETYDVEVTVPEDMAYEFRATSEDRTGATSLWLGSGMAMNAPVLPRLDYFKGMRMMNGMMKGNGMQMSSQEMDMNAVMYPELGKGGSSMSMDMPGMNMPAPGKPVTLAYAMLRSPVKTTLPENAPTKTFRFNLTGNMNRYVWSINNRTVSESDKILIKKGENIRIILYNGTMMRHPMHLHGHFFRLLNGQGDYSPLKNTLDIMPMETDTIEFAATESGDWFFHCHILYHMMSGMGRIFSYEDSPPNPEVPDPAMALKMVYMDDRMIHPSAEVALESNGSEGNITLADTRYRLQTEWQVGLDDRTGYQSETHIGRYLGRMQYWMPYVGWDVRYRRSEGPAKTLFGQTDTRDNRDVFCAGVEYLLPMLIVADARVDMKGNVRVQLSRQNVALTNRLRFDFMVNTDKEYTLGLRYVLTKYLGLSTHYDSDMGLGAGVTLNY